MQVRIRPREELEAESAAIYAAMLARAVEVQRCWEDGHAMLEPDWADAPLTAREMAVFEAGVFMGSLGREPEVQGLIKRWRQERGGRPGPDPKEVVAAYRRAKGRLYRLGREFSYQGCLMEAADELGCSRMTVDRRVEEAGLKPPELLRRRARRKARG